MRTFTLMDGIKFQQFHMASTFGQPLLQVTRQNFNLRNLDRLTKSMESQFPVSLLTTTNSDYATLPKIVISPAFQLILISRSCDQSRYTPVTIAFAFNCFCPP